MNVPDDLRFLAWLQRRRIDCLRALTTSGAGSLVAVRGRFVNSCTKSATAAAECNESYFHCVSAVAITVSSILTVNAKYESIDIVATNGVAAHEERD